MSYRAHIERLLHSKPSGLRSRALLLPLEICSYLYRAGAAGHALFYRSGLARVQRLPCRVVSIGNITVGGTGKTPLACSIAGRLCAEGYRVAVLSRGYRGTVSAGPLVVSDGTRMCSAAAESGDESAMLARRLDGVPVIAGRDRAACGRYACRRFDTQIAVLDDGFQHHRLARDADIVLINARNPLGNGFLLPRGILREHPRALGRADAVVLTKTGPEADMPSAVLKRINSLSPAPPLFRSRLRLCSLRRPSDGAVLDPGAVAEKTVAGVCGIGDPDSFFRLIESMSPASLQRHAFPDHHIYSADDYTTLQSAAQTVDMIITTEKDIAKFNKNMINNFKLIVLEISSEIDREADFFALIKKLCRLE